LKNDSRELAVAIKRAAFTVHSCSNLILMLQGLVQLPVPVIPPDLEPGKPFLLHPGHDLPDVLHAVLPLLSLPEQVGAHQADDQSRDLLVVGGELVVLPVQTDSDC